uniref:MRG domain-containing protein n=1 Tax=Clastoptera arizonana TaxID=38151 RepID=A0A1B6E3G2_9HEMI
MNDQGKLENDHLEWTPDLEVSLFYSIVGHKPVGPNRYFEMYFIHKNFCNYISKEVNVSVLWKKLGTMFDLATLDESESFNIKDDVFSLPRSIFGEYIDKVKLGIKDTDHCQTASLKHNSGKRDTKDKKVPKEKQDIVIEKDKKEEEKSEEKDVQKKNERVKKEQKDKKSPKKESLDKKINDYFKRDDSKKPENSKKSDQKVELTKQTRVEILKREAQFEKQKDTDKKLDSKKIEPKNHDKKIDLNTEKVSDKKLEKKPDLKTTDKKIESNKFSNKKVDKKIDKKVDRNASKIVESNVIDKPTDVIGKIHGKLNDSPKKIKDKKEIDGDRESPGLKKLKDTSSDETLKRPKGRHTRNSNDANIKPSTSPVTPPPGKRRRIL